jgi:hypothetical protein
MLPKKSFVSVIPNACWPWGEKQQWLIASTYAELNHRQDQLVKQFEPKEVLNVFDGVRAANKVDRGKQSVYQNLTSQTTLSTVHTMGRGLQKRNYTPQDTNPRRYTSRMFTRSPH